MGNQASAPSNFNVKQATYIVAALAASDDLAETVVWMAPVNCKVQKVRFMPLGATTVTTTSVLTVKKGIAGTTVATVSKATDYAAGTVVNLTVTDSAAELTEGQAVTFAITNTSAASPAGVLSIEWTVNGLVSS
jgi:hypothetical protein